MVSFIRVFCHCLITMYNNEKDLIFIFKISYRKNQIKYKKIQEILQILEGLNQKKAMQPFF